MRVRKLIRLFDTREDLPIDVNDVVGFLRDEQIKDEINFVGVEIDTEIMRGNIYHYTLPGLAYGEPKFCADIYYDKNQADDWKRLVCCKELMHLLDPDESRVTTKEQLFKLAEKIVLPAEFHDPIKDGLKVTTDRAATYFAVAVLFPWGARSILLAAYDEGKLTVDDIARIADIPPRYAAFVLSPAWEELHEIMVGEEDGTA